MRRIGRPANLEGAQGQRKLPEPVVETITRLARHENVDAVALAVVPQLSRLKTEALCSLIGSLDRESVEKTIVADTDMNPSREGYLPEKVLEGAQEILARSLEAKQTKKNGDMEGIFSLPFFGLIGMLFISGLSRQADRIFGKILITIAEPIMEIIMKTGIDGAYGAVISMVTGVIGIGGGIGLLGSTLVKGAHMIADPYARKSIKALGRAEKLPEPVKKILKRITSGAQAPGPQKLLAAGEGIGFSPEGEAIARHLIS
ncbi:hypothetical protein HY988_03600 [Candidatus Micrarchaeota archaeon]|nr:hypothetical protein [Candidatus Micrarchaeota archaeon]